MAKSICTVCENVFYSVGAFDKHRIGSFQAKTRRCKSEREMWDVGMLKNDKGIWTTGKFDASIFLQKVAQADQ